jgi:hypothetical protein
MNYFYPNLGQLFNLTSKTEVVEFLNKGVFNKIFYKNFISDQNKDGSIKVKIVSIKWTELINIVIRVLILISLE